MMMKPVILYFTLFLVIFSFVPLPVSGNTHEADYYAYGDSITGGPISSYDNNFIMKMRDYYDPSATALHNLDGTGRSSNWGLDNIATHSKGGQEYIFFGVNDLNGVNSPQQVAANQKAMYNHLVENGITPHILIQIVVANNTFGYGYSDFKNQAEKISLIQTSLTKQGIPFVKMYDAIDLHPCNGVPDPANLTLLSDPYNHPGDEAHKLMAKYLWNSTSYCATILPPTADFSANVSSGTTPLAIRFTDASNNAPKNWDWYWYANETKSSDNQNPTTILTTGIYHVRLYVSNANGGDWENKTGYINIMSESADSGNDVSSSPTFGSQQLPDQADRKANDMVAETRLTSAPFPVWALFAGFAAALIIRKAIR